MKKQKQKVRILNVSHDLHNFVGDDIGILKEKYEVDTLTASHLPILVLKFPVLLYKVARSDLVYLWFANPVSWLTLLFCKLFGKKSAMVSGGYDVVKMPEIDYGIHLHKYLRMFAVWSFKMVDEIILFSQSSKDDLKKNTGLDKGKVVFLAAHTDKFKPPKVKKQDAAVTVGTIRWSNLKRKGIETFVRAAKFAPDIEFWVIGTVIDDSIDHLKRIATKNVHFFDFGYDEKKIVEKVQRAKVYVQVSGHEGFGVAMVEGMLCECVPVVTARGAIPEVVGDTGIYVPLGDAKKTGSATKQALLMDGKKARQRALQFSVEARKKKVLKIVGKLFTV
ncbi:MAG: glycosyltransferase [Nanoarchaeota archaeon]